MPSDFGRRSPPTGDKHPAPLRLSQATLAGLELFPGMCQVMFSARDGAAERESVAAAAQKSGHRACSVARDSFSYTGRTGLRRGAEGGERA